MPRELNPNMCLFYLYNICVACDGTIQYYGVLAKHHPMKKASDLDVLSSLFHSFSFLLRYCLL